MSNCTAKGWILGLSLAANVLLLGYVLGCESMGPGTPPDHHARSEAVIKSLPAEKQAQMREILDTFKKDRKEGFEAIRAKRDEMRDILTAETFDADAFRARATELDNLFTANKKAMLEKMVTTAQNMSQEDRKLLADVLHRPMPGHGPEDRGGKGPGPKGEDGPPPPPHAPGD